MSNDRWVATKPPRAQESEEGPRRTAATSAMEKLQRALGAERAREVTSIVLRATSLVDLEAPDDRLKFARELMRRGGVLEAIGNSIAVQAILEGAKDSRTTGTFARPSAADLERIRKLPGSEE